MLGRTANGLFWMFRYLERAENTARLLDAGLRMSITRDNEKAADEWRSVIKTSGQQAVFENSYEEYSGANAWNFVLRDKANHTNIRSTFEQVRTNARMVRNAISSEVWEAINESWMKLNDEMKRPVPQSRVGSVVADIRKAGMLVHGAMAGSMLRDEGFHFARAGTFVERGDSIARILDIKYYLLLPSLSHVGSSLDTGQWDNVLRSVSGDRAYRWLNAGNIDARGIVEFLVLDERFPRSLAYCHAALRDNLASLARLHGREGESNEMMRASDMRMSEVTIDQIFDNGLHGFLQNFIHRNSAIGAAIADDYRFSA
ncbi:MAG: alpha-E domain-containing protein [Pontixanthobacter sp.]